MIIGSCHRQKIWCTRCHEDSTQGNGFSLLQSNIFSKCARKKFLSLYVTFVIPCNRLSKTRDQLNWWEASFSSPTPPSSSSLSSSSPVSSSCGYSILIAILKLLWFYFCFFIWIIFQDVIPQVSVTENEKY